MRFFECSGGEHGPPKRASGLRALAVLAAMFLIVSLVPSARANTISVALLSSTSFGVYTYEVSIAAAGTHPSSTDANANASLDSTGSDKFDNFTIYDFQGFLSVLSNTTGFTFTNGPVPGNSDFGSRDSTASYPDDPTQPNLVFKNQLPGGVTLPAGTTVVLGDVVLLSKFQGLSGGYFSSKDSDGATDGAQPPTTGQALSGFGSGSLPVPNPLTPAATPMPVSAACTPLLLGLLGVRKLRPARSRMS